MTCYSDSLNSKLSVENSSSFKYWTSKTFSALSFVTLSAMPFAIRERFCPFSSRSNLDSRSASVIYYKSAQNSGWLQSLLESRLRKKIGTRWHCHSGHSLPDVFLYETRRMALLPTSTSSADTPSFTWTHTWYIVSRQCGLRRFPKQLSIAMSKQSSVLKLNGFNANLSKISSVLHFDQFMGSTYLYNSSWHTNVYRNKPSAPFYYP